MSLTTFEVVSIRPMNHEMILLAGFCFSGTAVVSEPVSAELTFLPAAKPTYPAAHACRKG